MADMRTELDRHLKPGWRCDFTTPGFVHPDEQVDAEEADR